MDLVYLQTLLEVVETGSITKAADKLCVTQSAVSRRLKFVEEEYGLPLLDRSGPALKLTPAGEMVSEKAGRLLALANDLEAELQSRDWTRPLSFCCTPAFGMSHLPRIMRRFMHADRSANGVEIHFEIPERILLGMRAHHYDLAVLDFGECTSLTDLNTIPLPGDEIVFVSSAGLGIPSPDATLPELFAHTLFSRKEGCCSRRVLDMNLKAVGHTVDDFRNVVVIDDLHLIAQALGDEGGVSFLPLQVFRSEVEKGALAIHRVAEFNHKRCRTLLVGADLAEYPAAQEFVECVQALT